MTAAGWALFVVVSIGWLSHARSQKREIADQLLTLPDGSKTDRLVRLPCTPEQQAAFYSFVHSKIGTPYDWKAIAGFVTPGHEHDFDHVICSAFMTEALRKCGWFKWPLTVPFHRISPSNLFLVLSSHVEIPH